MLRTDPNVVASLVIAVIDGLALQWLLDPDDAPTGAQLSDALADVIAPRG